MTGKPTRAQIIEHCQRKMIAALEGRLAMQEVCGLFVESLRAALVAERTHLLERCGYEEAAERPVAPPGISPQLKTTSESIRIREKHGTA